MPRANAASSKQPSLILHKWKYPLSLLKSHNTLLTTFSENSSLLPWEVLDVYNSQNKGGCHPQYFVWLEVSRVPGWLQQHIFMLMLLRLGSSKGSWESWAWVQKSHCMKNCWRIRSSLTFNPEKRKLRVWKKSNGNSSVFNLKILPSRRGSRIPVWFPSYRKRDFSSL